MLSRARAALGRRIRTRLGITRLEQTLGDLEATAGRDFQQAWRLLDGHEDRLGRVERLVRMATVMAWIEQATLRTDPLVSIVLPTRNRAAVIARAISSVRRQSYSNWELLVCDDGGSDHTAAVVEQFGDTRVRYLWDQPDGVAAARNRGLDSAAGELITYLDDDNRMHPNWLKSVVWAFEQRPDVEVVYGGIIIDDTARLHREPGHEMPSAWLEKFDRETVLASNVADTSAIAHRAGLHEARWEESLQTMGDWDLFLRLTEHRDPLTLPVIAGFYYTGAPDRISDDVAAHEIDRPAIQERARRSRSRA